MSRALTVLLVAALAVAAPAAAPARHRSAALAAAAPVAPIRQHRVLPGESLWLLARRYDTTVADLARANHLDNPDLIRVDQVLTVPAPAMAEAAPPAAAEAAPPAAAPATASPDPPEPEQPAEATARPVVVQVFGLPAAPALAVRPRPVPPADGAGRAVLAAEVRLNARPAAASGSRILPAQVPAAPAVPAAAAGAAPLIRVHLPPGRCLVALTFNGLPEPARAGALLAALTGAGARATFFASGSEAAARPDLVRQLVGAGHELGTLGRRGQGMDGMTRLAAEADLVQAVRALQQAGAPAPRFFRPPGGLYAPELLAGAADVGLTPVLWSAINLRDRAGVPAPVLAAEAARAAFPGAVLLLHAGRPDTVAALPLVLEALARAGCRCERLGALLDAA